MKDITIELVSLFKENGINIISESVQDSFNDYPLVTYGIAENSDDCVGDSVGYSNIAVTVNIWATGKAELVNQAEIVADVMRKAEFVRSGGIEQNIGSLYRYVFTYRRKIREVYREV